MEPLLRGRARDYVTAAPVPPPSFRSHCLYPSVSAETAAPSTAITWAPVGMTQTRVVTAVRSSAIWCRIRFPIRSGCRVPSSGARLRRWQRAQSWRRPDNPPRYRQAEVGYTRPLCSLGHLTCQEEAHRGQVQSGPRCLNAILHQTATSSSCGQGSSGSRVPPMAESACTVRHRRDRKGSAVTTHAPRTTRCRYLHARCIDSALFRACNNLSR